jgi:hypothetical protein
MRNASFKLKSDFKARSILADSTSLSRNTISLRKFIISVYSYLFMAIGGAVRWQCAGSNLFSEQARFKGEQGAGRGIVYAGKWSWLGLALIGLHSCC